MKQKYGPRYYCKRFAKPADPILGQGILIFGCRDIRILRCWDSWIRVVSRTAGMLLQSFLKAFCSFLGFLEVSWEPLGPSWRPLGAFRESLGRSGRLWGSHFDDLGRSCEHLGASWSDLWSLLKASWESLGGSWEHFGSIWGRFWSYFGAWKAFLNKLMDFLKTLKNIVRYCKNQGFEGQKIIGIQLGGQVGTKFEVKLACSSASWS